MAEMTAIIISLLSGSLMYRKRYTSNLKIGGIYFVQLWYLLVTIIVVALFMNIGLDIIMRPTLDRLPLPSSWIFNTYALALIVTAIGSGIHSSSTSVYQSFKLKGKIEKQAYFTNELFHGPLSHNMVYLGSIASTVLLGLLELNHPLLAPGYNFNIIIVVGIMLGALGAMGILWSGHIGYTLIASLVGSITLGLAVRIYALNPSDYPFAILGLSSIVSMFSLVFLACLIFLVSERLSKKVIKRTFPQGHPFHEALNVKVLTLRIQRDWFKSY